MPDLPGTTERLVSAALPSAQLLGYPYLRRHAAWQQRLQINRSELNWLGQTSDAAGAHYATPSGQLRGSGRPVSAVPSYASGFDASTCSIQKAKQCSSLNVFIDIASDQLVADQFQQLGSRRAKGQALPLAGVPVAVKDLMAVSGFKLTAGSGRIVTEPSRVDADAVARLREAGAIVVGTTNLHELAYGITSANPHYGTVQNPASPEHSAGGSSGGSAAAVAAGIVDIAVGTDTAGSIRIPAACCGVVGFKPTYDLISRRGALDLGPSLDHLGPLAKDVSSAALAFSIMAGLTAQTPNAPASMQGIRVGIPSSYFFDPLSIPVEQALDRALQKMLKDGAQLVPVDIPGIQNSPAIQLATLCPEATAIHWQRLVSEPDSLGEDVRVRLEIGQFFPGLWYTRAQGQRQQLANAMMQAFQTVDVLVTPTLRTTAPAHGATGVTIKGQSLPLHGAITSLTLPFNLTGMPAISLPCGADDTGLPIGLQLAAWRYQDWMLLNIAARVEHILKA